MSHTNVNVRTANSDDVESMMKVLLAAWHGNYGAAGEYYAASEFADPNYATATGPYTNVEDFVRANVDSIRERLQQPFSALVACVDEKIVGYIICEQRPHAFWINDLVVSPERQGDGVGRRLFEHAIAGKTEKVWIWANAKNPAIDFWKKLGFEEVLQEKLMRRE